MHHLTRLTVPSWALSRLMAFCGFRFLTASFCNKCGWIFECTMKKFVFLLTTSVTTCNCSGVKSVAGFESMSFCRLDLYGMTTTSVSLSCGGFNGRDVCCLFSIVSETKHASAESSQDR